MPEVVSCVLAAHLARYRPGRYGRVFTSRTGNPLRRNTLGSMWHRARPVAGLPEAATFHDLRHFYASLLIAKGCSVKAVQRRLGHQSAMETLDTYGHLWPDSDDGTRNAVDLVLAGVRGRAERQLRIGNAPLAVTTSRRSERPGVSTWRRRSGHLAKALPRLRQRPTYVLVTPFLYSYLVWT